MNESIVLIAVIIFYLLEGKFAATFGENIIHSSPTINEITDVSILRHREDTSFVPENVENSDRIKDDHNSSRMVRTLHSL